MHLLALLMNQLNSAVTNLRLVDFVDISHLLLSICTSEPQQPTTPIEENQQVKGEFKFENSTCERSASSLIRRAFTTSNDRNAYQVPIIGKLLKCQLSFNVCRGGRLGNIDERSGR